MMDKSVRSLTRDQFLKIFGLTSGGFDAQQRAGHVALAFGTPIPSMPGRYFDLDLVAMALAAALAPTFGRQAATAIVLGFFDQWVAAVADADADADTARSYFFAMGGFIADADERRFREIWVTNGTRDQVMSDLHDASAVMAINITDILTRLRLRADAAGIDLSQAFFFPTNHARFAQIVGEFKREREARMSRLRQDKKKWRRHQALTSGLNIKAAPRLRDAQPVA
jgi:hypothetical protein